MSYEIQGMGWKKLGVIVGIATLVYVFMETTIYGAKIKSRIMGLEPASWTGTSSTPLSVVK